MIWNIPVSSPTLKSHPTSPGNTDEVPGLYSVIQAKTSVAEDRTYSLSTQLCQKDRNLSSPSNFQQCIPTAWN